MNNQNNNRVLRSKKHKKEGGTEGWRCDRVQANVQKSMNKTGLITTHQKEMKYFKIDTKIKSVIQKAIKFGAQTCCICVPVSQNSPKKLQKLDQK